MVARAAMNGLDARQLDRLAGDLERLKLDAMAGVRRSTGELSGEEAELSRDGGLSGDGAVGVGECAGEGAGAGQVRAALMAIVAAQRRLAKGDYGLCEDCGKEIGFARLEAQPAASRCVRCQETTEKPDGPARSAR